MVNEQKYPKINLSDISLGDLNYQKMKNCAKNGNLQSMHDMGMWYETVANDIEMAKYWYKRASDSGYEPADVAYKDLCK